MPPLTVCPHLFPLDSPPRRLVLKSFFYSLTKEGKPPCLSLMDPELRGKSFALTLGLA
jgi:hypothetical protein